MGDTPKPEQPDPQGKRRPSTNAAAVPPIAVRLARWALMKSAVETLGGATTALQPADGPELRSLALAAPERPLPGASRGKLVHCGILNDFCLHAGSAVDGPAAHGGPAMDFGARRTPARTSSSG